MKRSYVYIMASKQNGTLYVGVTSDLVKRVFQHKNDLIDGFTRKYSVKKLVYWEEHADIEEAIKREKRLKKWKRLWKLRLIEQENPEWRDLYFDLIEGSGPLPSQG